ncbi:MAG: sigma-70 family RNA polymerase sigma factor [Burkholderiales bacterium]|nr:sigma-70 family RNA polymerase sigma factor [Burkholderiales bacterium]
MSAGGELVHSEAVHVLYRDHHGWLYGWLRRRLGNAFDAADLAQDAFVRLLIRPREFDSFDGARAYLSVVAKGLCIDLWRRREIEQAWLDALAAWPMPVEPLPEHRAIVIEALCEIDGMLRRLPEKAAAAFVMAMACGMTDREVAVQLGVSDRMVRKYVARAMLQCLALELGPASDPQPVPQTA